MSHAAKPERREARALFEGSGSGMVVLMWALFSLVTVASNLSGVIDLMSTDDAMRLVEVRDWLGGQGWFDLAQHRLNPPAGVIMHWSRLIDLPIAALLTLSGRLLSADHALAVTLTVWPLLLLLPALLAVASASRTLAGDRAGPIGAFLMITSPAVTGRFAPAAIDHHGAQIALALILLACALKLDRSGRAALGAGFTAATMTAIGMETAPHVAACAAMIAMRWAFVGNSVAKGASLFGLSFAGGTAVIALATLAPASWSAPVCDTLGAGHLALALFGGLGLSFATYFGGTSTASRLAALAVVGLASAAALWLISPNCLSAPYAMLPERLQEDWLSGVQEAQPFVRFAANFPSSALALGLPLAVTLGVALWALATARREAFWPVATGCAMFAASLAVSAWQVRGMGLAFAMAGPLLPMAALALGRHGVKQTLLAIAALTPAALALVGLGLGALFRLPSVGAEQAMIRTCPTKDYAALDAFPAGIALNTIDTGPYILAFSRHSAIAAPYHRNVAGLEASLDAFWGGEAAARAVAVSRRAGYVVVCPLDGGVTSDAKRTPDGFSAALLKPIPPGWLAPLDLGPDAKLLAFRVLAGAPE